MKVVRDAVVGEPVSLLLFQIIARKTGLIGLRGEQGIIVRLIVTMA